MLYFRCKLGYFVLREDDFKGCIFCFCYGYFFDCLSVVGYYVISIISDFEIGKNDGKLDNYYYFYISIFFL